jgi:hypothetical protein
MRTLRRSKAVAALAAGIVVAGAGVAAADNLLSDGDDLAAFGNSDWALGTVCTASTDTKSVAVKVSRQGSATGTNTYKSGTDVSVSGAISSGAVTVESGSKTISLPSTWGAATNGDLSSPVSFQVGYTAPAAPGEFTGTITFTGSGTNSSNASINRTDVLTISGTAESCDSTSPVITPNVSGTSGNGGWYTSDVGLTWSVTDPESTISSQSGCDAVSITADQAATTYTCSATSTGGTTTESVTIKRDATAPVITPGDITDTTWRNTSLSQAFTAADATSGLANSADASFSLEASVESADADTPTTDSKSVSDAAGNTTTRTLSAKIDKTAPVVSYTSASGTQGTNGWYTSAVTATFTALDSLSGPASSTATASSGTAEGTVTLSSPLFADNATNEAPAGAATQAFKIDLSDPTTPTLSSFPAQSYATMVPAAPTCSSSDAVSDLASCVVTGYSTAVGPHTLTATATDNAGRTSTATLDYTVAAWTLKGFYSPVDMSGTTTTVWNSVKGGSTVPLKFEAFAGNELTNISAVETFKQQQVSCSSAGTALTDEIEVTSTGGTTLRYDATGGQFIQNWQTPKLPGKCYVVTMTTDDGSTLKANFLLK